MAKAVEAQLRALHPSIFILPTQVFAAGPVGQGLKMALHRILHLSRVGRRLLHSPGYTHGTRL
jgi:hypothetical protein